MEIGLLQAGSPARTSASPERAQESPERGLVFGLNIGDLLGIYDPDSQSWKTWEHSLFGGLMPFSDRFPKSGIMQNGKVYQQRMLVRVTKEKGYGSLPTPRTSDYKGGRAPETKRIENGMEVPKSSMQDVLNEKYGVIGKSSMPHPLFVEDVMGYPLSWTDLKDSGMRLSLK